MFVHHRHAVPHSSAVPEGQALLQHNIGILRVVVKACRLNVLHSVSIGTVAGSHQLSVIVDLVLMNIAALVIRRSVVVPHAGFGDAERYPLIQHNIGVLHVNLHGVGYKPVAHHQAVLYRVAASAAVHIQTVVGHVQRRPQSALHGVRQGQIALFPNIFGRVVLNVHEIARAVHACLRPPDHIAQKPAVLNTAVRSCAVQPGVVKNVVVPVVAAVPVTVFSVHVVTAVLLAHAERIGHQLHKQAVVLLHAPVVGQEPKALHQAGREAAVLLPAVQHDVGIGRPSFCPGGFLAYAFQIDLVLRQLHRHHLNPDIQTLVPVQARSIQHLLRICMVFRLGERIVVQPRRVGRHRYDAHHIAARLLDVADGNPVTFPGHIGSCGDLLVGCAVLKRAHIAHRQVKIRLAVGPGVPLLFGHAGSGPGFPLLVHRHDAFRQQRGQHGQRVFGSALGLLPIPCNPTTADVVKGRRRLIVVRSIIGFFKWVDKVQIIVCNRILVVHRTGAAGAIVLYVSAHCDIFHHNLVLREQTDLKGFFHILVELIQLLLVFNGMARFSGLFVRNLTPVAHHRHKQSGLAAADRRIHGVSAAAFHSLIVGNRCRYLPVCRRIHGAEQVASVCVGCKRREHPEVAGADTPVADLGLVNLVHSINLLVVVAVQPSCHKIGGVAIIGVRISAVLAHRQVTAAVGLVVNLTIVGIRLHLAVLHIDPVVPRLCVNHVVKPLAVRLGVDHGL